MTIITLYLVNGVIHTLVTFLSAEVGVPLSTAGAYMSLLFLTSLAGKVLWGFALDRPRQRLYALAACALLVLGGALLVRPVRDSADGALHLAPARGHAQLLGFGCTYGLGSGAAFTLVQSRAAQLYGGRSDYTTLQSILGMGQYLGSFLGVTITVQLRAKSGSFVTPYALMPLLALINMAFCVRVFQPRRAQSAHVRAVADHAREQARS